MPGKAHPYADQAISFQGVARSLDLGQLWPGGSKQPAIAQLQTRTLEVRVTQFCPLITGIVQKAITYRQNRGGPLTRDEIDQLNELVAELGFKIPELWDPSFLSGLDSSPGDQPDRADTTLPTEADLTRLKGELTPMFAMAPQQRGFQFERFLNEMFRAYGLDPRGSFRLQGEQIDGSLQLQSDTYLVEAKWHNEQIGLTHLLAFMAKVAGKAQWSRGLLISYSGFTSDGLEAFARGRPTNLVCVDGFDFHCVLEGRPDFRRLLELKARRAVETGESFVSARDLFPGEF